MTVKQISVFLENKSGRLAEVTKYLGEAGVNLRAVTIADTADFGILRLVVNETDKALALLESKGFTAKVTDVIGIEVEDRPGGLSKILSIFERDSVNIEYLYASLEKNQDKAVVFFKVENPAHGVDICKRNNLSVVSKL